MKSLIKDIVVFIAGVIAEMYIYFQMPYLEVRDGFGDGFMILLPVFVSPVIGAVMGLFIKRKFSFAFPIIPTIFSVPFMSAYYGDVSVGYILIFMFGTLLGVVIGWGIRILISSLVEDINNPGSK